MPAVALQPFREVEEAMATAEMLQPTYKPAKKKRKRPVLEVYRTSSSTPPSSSKVNKVQAAELERE
jgi:hypothetical protein